MNPPCDFTRQRSGPVSSVRTKPHSPTPFRSFHRCTEPITSFRYRLFADETKPELPLREAPGSLSIDLNLDPRSRATGASHFSGDDSDDGLLRTPTPLAARASSGAGSSDQSGKPAARAQIYSTTPIKRKATPFMPALNDEDGSDSTAPSPAGCQQGW